MAERVVFSASNRETEICFLDHVVFSMCISVIMLFFSLIFCLSLSTKSTLDLGNIVTYIVVNASFHII